MKKGLALFVGCAVGAAAMLQAADVTSVNSVGFQNITVPNGGLRLVRMDFYGMTTNPVTAGTLIGDQLPSGSSISVWDTATRSYRSEVKTRSGWPKGTNATELLPGVAFWMKAAATPVSNYTVTFSGEVPDVASSSILQLRAVNAVGYPYPASILWTNTQLAKTGVTGDSISLWTNTAYASYVRTRSGWGAANTLVIDPGVAFWFSAGNSATQNWTEAKPYVWP